MKFFALPGQPLAGIARARKCLVCVLVLLAGLQSARPAPFARRFEYQQPEGPRIVLWGQGDEFHSVFETLDGYTVVFDETAKSYCYATTTPDGSNLAPTPARVGEANPAKLGLSRHLRLSTAAVKAKVARAREDSERTSRQAERWQKLKATWRSAESSGPHVLSLPQWKTTGLKVGLALLVDFDDEPASIPAAEVEQWLNGTGYTGFGCNGSVRDYFWDNSKGKLLCTNLVIGYVRIPNSLHPRSYYDDTSRRSGDVTKELIRDTVNVLESQPNFATEILPRLEALTMGSEGIASVALLVSGQDSGVWLHGLWPNSTWNLTGQIGGKAFNRVQCLALGDGLSLYTMCHETGHGLCDFPDLYDYGHDSSGGAGSFCIMGIGESDLNPPQVCAYLKAAAGWATIVDLNLASQGSLALAAAPGRLFNRFYRFQRPGVDTEYFLLENRQQARRDASIPGSGVAIWHIDELGDRDNQDLTNNSNHQNFEVSLEQADNRWDLQRNTNLGDGGDLYSVDNLATGFQNVFSDDSTPDALWWDGSSSGLLLHSFGTNGDIISFQIGSPGNAPTITLPPRNQTTFPGGDAVLHSHAIGSTPLDFQWHRDGTPIPGATNSTLVVTNVLVNEHGYSVTVSNSFGRSTSSTVRIDLVPIAAWGANTHGQCNVPADVTNVTAIAGGRWFSMALLGDGTVRAWGDNDQGQCNVPADLREVSAIAAGSYFGMALLRNGTVRLWGSDVWEQISSAVETNGVKAIAAGQYHCLVLKSNGTVNAWGLNSSGQTDVPAGLTNVQAISAGWQTSLALLHDGSVIAWGSDDGAEAVPRGLEQVIAVAAGTAASLALKSDGTVVPWGSNKYDQLAVPDGLSDVVAITGYAHFLAQRRDGTVIGWGANDPTVDFGQAKVPPRLRNVRAIASHGRHSLALVDMLRQPEFLCLEPTYRDGSFLTKVQTIEGSRYSLESSESPSGNGWTVRKSQIGDGKVMVFEDTTPLVSQRYYRLRME